MHTQIYKFFNELKLESNDFSSKEPVPHVIIDDFLPASIFDEVSYEIKSIPDTDWSSFSNEYSYRKECRNLVNCPFTQTLVHSFHSSNFLHQLTSLTSIEKLIPDPHMRGGGICSCPTGNMLKLHTDFNWNEQLRLTRKVNLILYLNKTWNKDWGGELEFWDFEKTKCVTKVSPIPNRLIIWNYDERLVHGFPDPLNTPKGVSRDNLILFYYNSNATHETPPHRSLFV